MVTISPESNTFMIFPEWQIPIGVSIACSIRIGQFLGSGMADEAKTSSRVAFVIVCKFFLDILLFRIARFVAFGSEICTILEKKIANVAWVSGASLARTNYITSSIG